MSIYAELLQKADKGKRFKVDLKNKNLWLGAKQVISEGTVLIDEDELINKDDLNGIIGEYVEIDLSKDCWQIVSVLFEIYKHSVPNKHWKDNGYFRALNADDLTTEELAYGIDRKFSQAILDGYILLASLNDWLVWRNDDHWFWQSDENPECVVLKEWIKK